MPMAYVYNPGRVGLTFREARDHFVRTYPQVETGPIDNVSPHRVQNVLDAARAAGVPVEPFTIDIPRYWQYFEAAGYAARFPEYYRGNQQEKALEHFIALDLLAPGPADVFVDIASEHSPVPEIYWRMTGCCAFSQDITYPAGIEGNHIGGDAAAMPVRDGFVKAAALTCSLEHFEADADQRLFAELTRVLQPGGRVCVVPFYVYEQAATQTDPLVSLNADVPFDEDTVIHCAENWGNRHGRFYSPATFRKRLVDRFSHALDFRVYHLVNAGDVHPSIYARFAFTATRK